MKIPNPKIPLPRVPVPNLPSSKLPMRLPGLPGFTEPRLDRLRGTLRSQITGAMRSGKSYGETIAPTLRAMEGLLPRVARIEGDDAVARELCALVTGTDLQCGIQEFCLAVPELDCLKHARILDYSAASTHLTTSAAALIGARFDDGGPPPAIDTAMAFDAVFIKLGTAPHEDHRSRFYTRLNPREIMEVLSRFEYRPY